jgi:hypothetical protein
MALADQSWYIESAFGTKRPWVRIPPPRPRNAEIRGYTRHFGQRFCWVPVRSWSAVAFRAVLVRSRFMLDISVPVGALRFWDAVPVRPRQQFR